MLAEQAPTGSPETMLAEQAPTGSPETICGHSAFPFPFLRLPFASPTLYPCSSVFMLAEQAPTGSPETIRGHSVFSFLPRFTGGHLCRPVTPANTSCA
jgi:hypothetical protein